MEKDPEIGEEGPAGGTAAVETPTTDAEEKPVEIVLRKRTVAACVLVFCWSELKLEQAKRKELHEQERQLAQHKRRKARQSVSHGRGLVRASQDLVKCCLVPYVVEDATPLLFHPSFGVQSEIFSRALALESAVLRERLHETDSSTFSIPSLEEEQLFGALVQIFGAIDYISSDAAEEAVSDATVQLLEGRGRFDGNPLSLSQDCVFELIRASHRLQMKRLQDGLCKYIANIVKGKTPYEIRRIFNIKNDFTPEEEEQIRKENEWCEER